MNHRSSVTRLPFPARSIFLRIAAGAAAAVLGAESSLADGWTLANVALITLSTALIGWALADFFRPVVQTQHNRFIRFAWSGLFAVYAVYSVVVAFHKEYTRPEPSSGSMTVAPKAAAEPQQRE